MFRLLPAVMAITFLVACSSQPESNQPDIDLVGLYFQRDHSALADLVRFDHPKVRARLQKLLNASLAARANTDRATPDSSMAALIWLCNQYRTASGNPDQQRQLHLYSNWSSEQAREKLALDSTYTALAGRYQRQGSDSTKFGLSVYVQSLKQLRRRYMLLADTSWAASVDRAIAGAFYEAAQTDSVLAYIAHCKEISGEAQQHWLGECEALAAKVYNLILADFGQAQKALVRAADHFQKIGRLDRVARIRLEQAYIFSQLYQTDRAIQGYRDALGEYVGIGDEFWQGYCLYILAEAYYDKGMLDSAVEFARASLDMRRDFADDHPRYIADVGYSLSCLGLIAQAQGDHSRAGELYDEAAEVFQQAGNVQGQCINNMRLASLLIEQESYDAAAQLFRYVIANSTHFEDDINTRYGLAVCDYYNGDPQAAMPKLRLCINRLERSRQRLPMPEIKSGMLSDKIGFYQLMACIFIEQYNRSHDLSALDSAFHYIERSKAKTLNDLLLAEDGPGMSDAEENLIDSISSLENGLILGVGDTVGYRRSIRQLEDSLYALRVILADSGVTIAKEVDIPNLRATQAQQLKDGDLLLEYLVSEFGSYVIIVSPSEVAVAPIEMSRGQLRRTASEYLRAISMYPQPGDDPRLWREAGRSLYSALIPEDNIKRMEGRHLIVVASGLLHYLPFGALIDDKSDYLVEKYDISYAPSAATLDILSRRQQDTRSASRIIAFGNPSFGNSDIAPLPHSESEVLGLVDIFGQKKVDIYLGKNATETAFVGADFETARYLHVATHGFVDDRRPGRSALLFASEGSESGQGLLQASEIRNLNIPAEMVFLSACRSGSGGSFPGEGVLSLTQPFLEAGCNSVVVTYWNINDRCSVQLVKDFYTLLKEGDSKAGSLARAQRNLINSERKLYRQPFFWAPFVLSGLNN